jgi:hypothetical protein
MSSMKGAGDRAKARIEKRIAGAKADFNVRSKKLNQGMDADQRGAGGVAGSSIS